MRDDVIESLTAIVKDAAKPFGYVVIGPYKQSDAVVFYVLFCDEKMPILTHSCSVCASGFEARKNSFGDMQILMRNRTINACEILEKELAKV